MQYMSKPFSLAPALAPQMSKAPKELWYLGHEESPPTAALVYRDLWLVKNINAIQWSCSLPIPVHQMFHVETCTIILKTSSVVNNLPLY